MNKLPDKINESPLDFDNTTVAITAIIMIGIFAIYKTHTDAKYNRETVCSYDDTNNCFTFVSRPVTANNTTVCPA